MQNLVLIDSAVSDLRMHEKHVFVWIFFKINMSARFFVAATDQATGHISGAILTLDGSNYVFLQSLVPFGVTLILLPLRELNLPKRLFSRRD